MPIGVLGLTHFLAGFETFRTVYIHKTRSILAGWQVSFPEALGGLLLAYGVASLIRGYAFHRHSYDGIMLECGIAGYP